MKSVYSKNFTVKKDETAKAVGSGGLPVLSTPSMIAYMENTAFEAAEEKLEEEQTTVGIELTVKHLSPTAVEKDVKIIADIIDRTDRTFIFQIEAYSDGKLIGEARHKRAVVDAEEFMRKV